MTMRRTWESGLRLAIVALAIGAIVHAQAPAQERPGTGSAAGQGAGRGRGSPEAVFNLQDNFLQWRLLPTEKTYESIDGKRLWQYVSDLAAISRHYRDSGHPQFWGRIIGSSADDEGAHWLMKKMTEIGLANVHTEPIDLDPQWFPQSWDLTATSPGKTLQLKTAQPTYRTPGTTRAGLDLQIVYAGLGSEADLAGRDLKGKAVLIFSYPMPGSWRHTSTQEGVLGDDGTRSTLLQLAQQKGAAAIICSIQLAPVVGTTVG